jgi:hypothetical protein
VRQAHLTHRNPKASLNRENDGEDSNAIDWARRTWNPITGCNHNCPYCFARDIATRFSGSPAYPNGFIPTFRADHLSAPLNGAPRASDGERGNRVFAGSMTDLFGRWVPAEWINAVLCVARQTSQWEFLMLTKFPKRMAEFAIPPNVWMGTSVDCQARVAAAEAAFERVSAKVRWLSCEPNDRAVALQAPGALRPEAQARTGLDSTRTRPRRRKPPPVRRASGRRELKRESAAWLLEDIYEHFTISNIDVLAIDAGAKITFQYVVKDKKKGDDYSPLHSRPRHRLTAAAV